MLPACESNRQLVELGCQPVVKQVSAIILWIPPKGCFSDSCCLLVMNCIVIYTIVLIHNEIEIASGAIDIVDQDISGEFVIFAVPLGIQLGKELCGERVAHAATESACIECFLGKNNAIELKGWLDSQARIWFDSSADPKTVLLSVEEIPRFPTQSSVNTL